MATARILVVLACAAAARNMPVSTLDDAVAPGTEGAGGATLLQKDLDCVQHCQGRCFSGRCLFEGIDLDEGDAGAVAGGVPAAVLAPPASRLRGGEAEQVQQPWKVAASLVAESATAESAQTLIDRVQLAESVAAKLADENTVLRQQLESWHEVGERVAARDASLSEIIQVQVQREEQQAHAHAEINHTAAAAAAANISAQELARQQVGTQVSAGNSTEEPHGHRMLALLATQVSAPFHSRVGAGILAAALIPLAAAVLLLMLRDEGNQRRLKDALKSSLGSSKYTPSVGRAMGLTEYCIEIGEIRVGNIGELQLAGKASVVIFVGSNKVAQTLAVPLANTCDVLTFPEVLRFNVSRFGGPVFVNVCDQDLFVPEGAANVRISTSDFLRKACDRQEYFTFNLSPIGRAAPWAQRMSEQQPCIAMRVQDVSHIPSKAAPLRPGGAWARKSLPRGL